MPPRGRTPARDARSPLLIPRALHRPAGSRASCRSRARERPPGAPGMRGSRLRSDGTLTGAKSAARLSRGRSTGAPGADRRDDHRRRGVARGARAAPGDATTTGRRRGVARYERPRGQVRETWSASRRGEDRRTRAHFADIVPARAQMPAKSASCPSVAAPRGDGDVPYLREITRASMVGGAWRAKGGPLKGARGAVYANARFLSPTPRPPLEGSSRMVRSVLPQDASRNFRTIPVLTTCDPTPKVARHSWRTWRSGLVCGVGGRFFLAEAPC